VKKLGPEETIANVNSERKGETAKNRGKMRFFLTYVQNAQLSCGLRRFGIWLAAENGRVILPNPEWIKEHSR
jgi:hypothetical protein